MLINFKKTTYGFFFFFFLVNQIFISKIVRLKKVYFANDFAVVVQHKALRAEVKFAWLEHLLVSFWYF